MDYKALALDACKLTRRGRPLLWLGLVSAAQAVFYEAIVLALTLPLLALPQLMTSPGSSGSAAGMQLDVWRELVLVWLTDAIAGHGTSIVVAITGVFVVWIVLGVLDVASQTGLITQAHAAENGSTPSFATGMRDGFRVWWRVVGLLAIAVLPALFSMTLLGLVVLFTMTLPLLRGQAPDPTAGLLGNAMLAPFSAIASLIGIPLGLTVQLGMRNAVLGDEDWRASFSAGWKLLRGNVIEVVVVYLLLAAVGLGVGIVVAIVVSVVGVVATAGIVALALGGGAGTATVATVLTAMVALIGLLSLPVTVLVFVWNSCVWTLYWSRKRADELLGVTMTDGHSTSAV